MKFLKALAFASLLVPIQAFAIAAYPMSFWGTAKIDGVSAPVGTVIAVYDASFSMVGSVVVSEAGIYGYDNPLKQRLLLSEALGNLTFKVTSPIVNAGVETTGIDAITYNAFASGVTIRKDLNFRTVLTVTQVTPDATGAVTVTATTTQAVITNPTLPIALTIATGTLNPSIDVSSLITNGVGVLPEITITSADTNNTTILISASTTVTSASSTWDGVIAAPTITTISIPDTTTEVTTLSTAIEIGFSGAELSFDKAVRILLSGQAGKKAGYVRDGIPFTEITALCVGDDQASGDALPAGDECKMDVGADLVIWTKHFTTFATYTTSTISKPTSSSAIYGGGGFSNQAAALASINALLSSMKPKGKVLGVSTFNFLQNLGMGSRGVDVVELQKVLIQDKLLFTSATGYFGPLTKAAVMKWQAKNKVPPTGFFGPMTRLALQSKVK